MASRIIRLAGAMRARWARKLTLGLAAAIVVGATACSGGDDGAPRLAQPDQTGEELSNRFITLIKDKDAAALEAFLADSFMIQRADGSFATKADYLTKLPAIGPFQISNVTTKQEGGVLVVRWDLTVQEVINGQTFNTAPAPRLSTYLWSDREWQMSSHANFNTPVAANPPAAPQ